MNYEKLTTPQIKQIAGGDALAAARLFAKRDWKELGPKKTFRDDRKVRERNERLDEMYRIARENRKRAEAEGAKARAVEAEREAERAREAAKQKKVKADQAREAAIPRFQILGVDGVPELEVAKAFVSSDLSVDDWNSLPEGDRKERIASVKRQTRKGKADA